MEFYRRTIGLEPVERAGGGAVLGAGGGDLVVLVEQPGARPSSGHTGLYHFALVLPQRADLARWLAHAARERVPLQGLSDHFVSEAIYLGDPDGHGIEIYWDRPRERWEGQVAARMTTLPLDVADLFGELDDPAAEPFDGLSAGTAMGHVHLKVGAIPETIAFYRDVLGFGLMAQLGLQAAFFGAGGYHHHVGANTWESAGATPPPAGTAGLRHATIVLPGPAERDRLVARVEHDGRRCGTPARARPSRTRPGTRSSSPSRRAREARRPALRVGTVSVTVDAELRTSTCDELGLLDGWWRAANYLSVGQIYLLDNPLLRTPLAPEQIKPRLLGHWGTTPGLNLIYAHVNLSVPITRSVTGAALGTVRARACTAVTSIPELAEVTRAPTHVLPPQRRDADNVHLRAGRPRWQRASKRRLRQERRPCHSIALRRCRTRTPMRRREQSC